MRNSTSEVCGRYIGSLIGLAAGDALGTTLEFKPPGSFAPIDTIVGGGPFHLKPGQWTDDTSMALCLADSLVQCQGFDAQDQIDRYLRWYEEGYLSSTGSCFDIGNATRAALERYQQTGNPIAGSDDPRAAGNGSIMRLAPVALYYAALPEAATDYCVQSSATTHGTRECLDACAYFGALLVGAVCGADKEELLSPRYHPVAGFWQRTPLCPGIDNIAAGSFRHKEPPAIKGSGYVVQSLEAALWAFYKTDNFREGALLAVNLGDDADTTGAVYGQLAGAYYGIDGIPSAWRQVIYNGSFIEELAMKLYQLRVEKI